MKRNIEITQEIKYVIGIDFGHAETSAASCEIEWDKPQDLRDEDIKDLKLGRDNREFIVSTICELQNGGYSIGEEALKQPEIKNIQIGFKTAPTNIEGEKEKAMVAFMKEIYQQIRRSYDYLTDTNHVVFIARPADWDILSTKELYIQMAVKAGIPIFDLTSEPRAALTYAYDKLIIPEKFRNGGLVFDLGSSTLDLTYRTGNNKPIDKGTLLGASIIDNAIFKHYIECQSMVQVFLKEHPEYKDKFVYYARKIKEEIYDYPDCPYHKRIDIEEIIANRTLKECEQYKERAIIDISIQGAQELEKLEEVIEYQVRLKNFIKTFYIDNALASCGLYGVIMTGGASVMKFLPTLIKEACYSENFEILKERNPRLTVSRGIALLGMKDLRAEYEKQQIKNQLPQEFSIDKIDISEICKTSFEELWKVMIATIDAWKHKDPQPWRLKTKIEEEINGGWDNISNNIGTAIFREIIHKNSELILTKYANVLSEYVSREYIKNIVQAGETLSSEEKEQVEQIMWGLKEQMIQFVRAQNFDTITFWQLIRSIFGDLSRESRFKENARNMKSKMGDEYNHKFSTEYTKEEENTKKIIADIIENRINQILDYVKIPIE